MAFSTQRGFLHFPFLNQYPLPYCPPMEGVRLKTYAEIRDGRAWSLCDRKRSQYLMDLVSCRMYDDDGQFGDHSVNSLYPTIQRSMGEFFCRDNAENDELKNRLNESEEKLKILAKENEALNACLNEELPLDLLEKIKIKICQLQNECRIDKCDGNELISMLDDLSKPCRKKLSHKSDHGGSTSPDSEKCKALQREVDALKQEVCRLKCGSKPSNHNMNKYDVESLDTVIAERNLLREKMESFASLEGKITEWKHESEQFRNFKKKACMALKQKDEKIQDCEERIEEVEYQFKEMVKCFKMKEQEHDSLRSTHDCMKKENHLLKEELCRCKCDLKAVGPLHNQIQLLSNELCEKNCAIEQYDLQFQQLLNVIEGLQCKLSQEHECIPSKPSENIEELAATTRATLDQISKELESRHELETELGQSIAQLDSMRRTSQEREREALDELNAKKAENLELTANLKDICEGIKDALYMLDIDPKPGADCLAELYRLKDGLANMKSDYKDKLEKLERRSLQQDDQLRKENDDLQRVLEECQQKTKALDQNTKEVGKLVNDISRVKGRNSNLQSVLDAVDNPDNYKQEIENLKKKLEEEKNNNKRLSQQMDNQEKCISEIGELQRQLDAEREKNKRYSGPDIISCQKQLDDLKKQLDAEKRKVKELDDLQALFDLEKIKNKRLSDELGQNRGSAAMAGGSPTKAGLTRGGSPTKGDLTRAGGSPNRSGTGRDGAGRNGAGRDGAGGNGAGRDNAGGNGAGRDGAGGNGAGINAAGRDGASRDGKGRNGTGRDGMGRDGMGRDGAGRDDTGSYGTGSYGTGRDGMGRDGMGRDGTGRDGTGRDGMGRDGTGRDGTGRDGTGRDGTGRDGTGRYGTGKDGTGRDGTGRDGTGRGGTGRDGRGRDGRGRDGRGRDSASRDRDSRDGASRDRGSRDGASRDGASRDGSARRGSASGSGSPSRSSKDLAKLQNQLDQERRESELLKEQLAQARKQAEKDRRSSELAREQLAQAKKQADKDRRDSEIAREQLAQAKKQAADKDRRSSELARLNASKGKLGDEHDTKGKSATPSPSDKKKLMQLQKLHEATRNAERSFYEKEIEGHRMSNELLKNSLTKLTSKFNSCSVQEFEREMRCVLDQFIADICKWRSEKNVTKLTKLQEICKKILEYGIHCLSYKELVYLHQRMSEAVLRLKPCSIASSTTATSETNSSEETICCKCSGRLCEVPINLGECNKIFLEKMASLEREIEVAREELRKSKAERAKCNCYEVEQSDSETLRDIPNTCGRLAARKNASKPPKPIPFSYKIKEEEFQIPTKDRYG